jgi:hypothetical protein
MASRAKKRGLWNSCGKSGDKKAVPLAVWQMCRGHIKEMNLAEKRDRLPAPFTAPTTAGYANFVVDQCKGFMFGRSECFRPDMP